MIRPEEPKIPIAMGFLAVASFGLPQGINCLGGWHPPQRIPGVFTKALLVVAGKVTLAPKAKPPGYLHHPNLVGGGML